jgi:hypothetical protein
MLKSHLLKDGFCFIFLVLNLFLRNTAIEKCIPECFLVSPDLPVLELLYNNDQEAFRDTLAPVFACQLSALVGTATLL